MRSEAGPPARNNQNSSVLTAFVRLTALSILMVSIFWMTSCAGVSTAAPASQQTSTTSITVSISPSSATVTSAGTKQFTATVANTSNTAVTWSTTVGTISSTGLYQAPTVTTNKTGIVTAASAADSTKSASAAVTVTPSSPPPPPTLTITTSSLPYASVGTAYSSTLAASGGQSPYTWVITSGNLPTGVALQSSGALSGTATQWGQFVFTAKVADASSPQQMATQTFTLAVNNTPVTITNSSLATATAGTAYSATLSASGGQSPYSWTLSSGGLPTGIALQSSGSLSGTTTQWGQFVFTVQVADASSPQQTASQSFTLTVNNTPVVVTKSTIANATSGTAYAVTLSASGGLSPYTWSLASGSLPAGITLQSGGSLSGTTSQTGQFTFGAQAADSSSPQQSATQSFTLTVNSAVVGNTIPLSFFGADFNTGVIWPGTDGLGQTATLGGIRLWDDMVKWSNLNTASGVYDWTALDAWLADAQSSNVDVLYTFGATPQFAAAATPPPGCLSPGPYSCAPPVDVNADGTGTDDYFSAFVTALVTHAAGRISYYELWNEPDALGFWSGTTAQLVRMGQDAASIIRSLDPNAKILSPSAHGWSMSTWFDGYIAAGGAPNFDIVNVHMRGGPSTNASPEQFLTVYTQVETELTARSLTTLPLWDDEHGIEQNDNLNDPDMLAGYAARSAVLRAGIGLQRQYVYTWDCPIPSLGMQGNASGTAWDQTASWLINHSISACVANGTIYSCQLDDGLIVWDTAQSCSNGVCTTSSFTYPSAYLWYHDIQGNRTALSGGTVAIGYKPILLTSQ